MSQPECGCSGGPQSSCAPLKGIRDLSTSLSWRDVAGGWGVRWGIRRMSYLMPPGLYRIGQPDAGSPVLVTANYKLTIDVVRSELKGMNIWLLALDTKGVNVWCAAGKGTFGTCELIRRVKETGLAGVVRHRTLVLPQLGAVGVAAHEVSRATGFSVHYGPVRAADIRAYLAAGMRATPGMRRVTFNWRERMAVAPLEIVGALKPAFFIFAALAALDLIRNRRLTSHLAADMAPFLAAILTGGVLVPLLLPWLPTRIFAVKGAAAGLCVAALLLFLIPTGAVSAAGIALLVLAIVSYMGMVFTGATTYTTLAGARAEVRWALRPILVSAAAGAVLRVAGAFL